MTLEVFKQKIQGILELGDAFSIQTYLGIKEGEDIVVKKANIRRQALSDISEAIKDSLLKELERIDQDNEFELLNLSDGEDQFNVIYKYDLPVEPAFFNLIREASPQVADEAVANIPIFNNVGGDCFDNIDCFIHRVGSEDNNISIYRKKWNMSVLHQGRSFRLLRMDNNQITTIKEDLMKMDFTIDVMKIDNEFFILNLKMLHTNNQFSEVIRMRAEEAIEVIAENGLLSSTECLTQRLNEPSFSRKLMKAIDSSPILDMDPNVVIGFIQNNQKIRNLLKISDNKITLDTKKSQDFFIRLLNDDLLHSQLTNEDYSVGSKKKY